MLEILAGVATRPQGRGYRPDSKTEVVGAAGHHAGTNSNTVKVVITGQGGCFSRPLGVMFSRFISQTLVARNLTVDPGKRFSPS